VSESGFVPMPEWIAPEGQIWICHRCGKKAKYRGGDAPGYPASFGWDESCFISSVLVDEKTLRPVLRGLSPEKPE
jgi:hypothetical protein